MPLNKGYSVKVTIEVRETEGYSSSRTTFAEIERMIAADESHENAVNDAVLTAHSEVDRQFLAASRARRRAKLEEERDED